MTNKKQEAAGKLIEFHQLEDTLQEMDRKHFSSKPKLIQGQGKILMVLMQEDHISQRTLARRLGSTAQSTNEFIQKLEKKGLVKRSRKPDDRRIVLVDITEAGRAEALDLAKNVMPFLKVLNDQELEQLSGIFDKINRYLNDQIEKKDPTWQGKAHSFLSSILQDWFGDD